MSHVDPGKRITQADVARQCGVARTTVSAVFRDAPNIPPATAARIRAEAAKMGYAPGLQQAARRLIANRYGTRVLNRAILLVLPGYFHKAQFFSRMVDGVHDVMTGAGVMPIHCDMHLLEGGNMHTLPPLVACGEFDGILYHGSAYSAIHALAPVLAASHGQSPLPLVAMMGKDMGHPSVHIDERQGTYLAMRHLLAQGHSQFLLAWHPWGHPVWNDRLAGIRQALHEVGLDPAGHLHYEDWYFGSIIPPYHLAVTDVQPDSPSERQAIEQGQAGFLGYLEAHPEVTAILAQNDAIARRIACILKRTGRRVPEDISLVGFDDTDPLLDDEGRNCLTTVHVPLEDIGATAARQLLAWIHGTPPAQPLTVLPTSLTVRRTTAAPAT